jgi:hypothetical protein
MKKLIIVLICLYSVSVNAQDIIDPETLKKQDYTPLNAIVCTVGGGIPLISNDLMKSDVWNTKLGFGTQVSVDFRKHFTKEKVVGDNVVDYPTIFAVGVGLGVSYYNKSAYFDDFSETLTGLTDIDGDKYDARLSYLNIKEKVSMLYLDIPLYVEFGKPSLTKLGVFGKIGLKPSLLVSKNFQGEGAYSLSGYYPEWDVLLHDVDHLGFYDDRPAYQTPEYEYKPFVLWANLSAGITIPLSSVDRDILRKTVLRVGVKYDFTVMNISAATSESAIPWSSYRINQSNMLGGNGSKMHYIGLDFALMFTL